MNDRHIEDRHIGVVGAGQMGAGIAQVCALSGFRVTLIDVSPQALARSVAAISAGLEKLRVKGRIGAEEQAAAAARVRTATEHHPLGTTDFVIEAATEDPQLKEALLTRLSAVAPAHSVIATNTSSISISQLAAAVGDPTRFVGLHFFNPVPLMDLVEVVRGLRTSDETVARACAFARALDKTPIPVRNAPGFVVNRLLCPMINEAIQALHEGLATAEDIDRGMKLGCNHPIGPLALADLIGLDTLLAVLEVMSAGFGDPKYRPSPLLREMVSAGLLGRKTGRGFYAYGAA